MTGPELRVNLAELLAPLARTVDMMSPAIANHHMQVGYLALRFAEAMGLPPEERRDIGIAGLLHDIGGFSLGERLDLLRIEDARAGDHAQAGYLLLKEFAPFRTVAEIVRYHHTAWEDGTGATVNGRAVPRGSHILQLADRAAVILTGHADVLGRVEVLREFATRRAGSVFLPEHVATLLSLTRKDYVWLEAMSRPVEAVVMRELTPLTGDVGVGDLTAFARLLCRVVDFKSRFTATHSSGVAAVATAIARLEGLSDAECALTQVAALLHDVGKLAVPSEILEKTDKLTDAEWRLMRTHVFYTYQVLSSVPALQPLVAWGALHQERLDGSGYPFCHTGVDLTAGARIMAVADVFTALTEDRPYRNGMGQERAAAVLQDMARRDELDAGIVARAVAHFAALDAARAEAQARARREYEAFAEAIVLGGE